MLRSIAAAFGALHLLYLATKRCHGGRLLGVEGFEVLLRGFVFWMLLLLLLLIIFFLILGLTKRPFRDYYLLFRGFLSKSKCEEES